MQKCRSALDLPFYSIPNIHDHDDPHWVFSMSIRSEMRNHVLVKFLELALRTWQMQIDV